VHLFRKGLFDDLHDNRWIAHFGLGDEQMKVFGHNHVSVDEAKLRTCFFQYVEEPISTFRCTQNGLTPVAAAGDEMQVLCTVVAMELSRHRIRLAGMRDLDCDRALNDPVMKHPHIANYAMCRAPGRNSCGKRD
jgi:hypothetical protein